MTDKGKLPKARDLPGSSAITRNVSHFLATLAKVPRAGSAGRARVLFALDATASRQPTWDLASQIQAEMFQVTEKLGGLDVQLVYYRGFGECRASPWVATPQALRQAMLKVSCLAGRTQIAKVLGHGLRQSLERRVQALVFIGDAMEEDPDLLGDLAGRLGLCGTPVFLFHEGNDRAAGQVFEQIARLSGGAYCRFDPNSARQLQELLAAVAVYAAGGIPALKELTHQKGGKPLARLTAALSKPHGKAG